VDNFFLSSLSSLLFSHIMSSSPVHRVKGVVGTFCEKGIGFNCVGLTPISRLNGYQSNFRFRRKFDNFHRRHSAGLDTRMFVPALHKESEGPEESPRPT